MLVAPSVFSSCILDLYILFSIQYVSQPSRHARIPDLEDFAFCYFGQGLMNWLIIISAIVGSTWCNGSYRWEDIEYESKLHLIQSNCTLNFQYMYQSKLSMKTNYISFKAIVQTFNVGISFGTPSLSNAPKSLLGHFPFQMTSIFNQSKPSIESSKRHLVQSKF